jgi:hypothetical protein
MKDVVIGGASDNWREDILKNVHLNDREVYMMKRVINMNLRRTVCEDRMWMEMASFVITGGELQVLLSNC